MLEMAFYDGIRHMVATPHYITGTYETKADEIREKTDVLNSHAQKRGMDITIYAGQEINADAQSFSALAAGELLTLNNSKYALIEIDPQLTDESIKNALEAVFEMGMIPVIAHAERLLASGRNIDMIFRLFERGTIIQVNADSIKGDAGTNLKRNAHLLLKKGLVHAVSSDCHSPAWRPPALSVAEKEVKRICGGEQTKKLMYINPYKIISNKDLV